MTVERPARIIVRTATSAAAIDAWALITDWPAQSRWIPFTRVARDKDIQGVGACFTGRTGFGPLGFDDPMEVTVWEPPAEHRPSHCAVVKRGRWIQGTAEVMVDAAPGRDGGAAITWIEQVRIVGVPAAFNPLVRVAGGILFRGA